MKKLSVMVLALFLLETTGQLLGGMGQIIGGTVNTIANPTSKAVADAARWAGHYEYVEEGNDASAMSVTG